MVKFASSLFVAALIAAPALASINNDAFVESREVSDMEHDIIARDIQDLFTRLPHELSDMEIRELQELDERSFKSFFKKIGRGLKKAVSFILRREDLEEVFGRDIDELNERDLDEFLERFFSEIEERSLSAFNEARETFDEEGLLGRGFFDDDELAEREFFDNEELLERDLEEIDELD